MRCAPFSCPIQVRWRDLDAFQHVNNAAFVTYLEVARAELWRARFGGGVAADIPFVIARLEIVYKRPVRLYDAVQVELEASEIAGASFRFRYRITSNGELAATAETTQVCVDSERGNPVRIPAAVRAILETLQG
jgi:acyl-CoA thioester hydrolase